MPASAANVESRGSPRSRGHGHRREYLEPPPLSDSIGPLLGGVAVGLSVGLTLALVLGPSERALLAALTASITTAVTSEVVGGRLRGDSEPSAI